MCYCGSNFVRVLGITNQEVRCIVAFNLGKKQWNYTVMYAERFVDEQMFSDSRYQNRVAVRRAGTIIV